MPFLAGAASVVINPEIGDELAGQMHRRICGRIRDDLEANLLYLTDGREKVLLASLDLVGLEVKPGREISAAISAKTGIPAGNVILCCTHTHSGPVMQQALALHDSVVNERYLPGLRTALVEAAAAAVASARPARVGWGQGTAQVGFNRRLCWADGTHSMYGDAFRPDFTGLEGPDDPRHVALFAAGTDGQPLAIAHNNSCHATCVEQSLFVSADFPGEARSLIRAALGQKGLPVLYLQGASGDTSPWNMLRKPHRYDGEQRLREVGAALAAETLRLLHETVPVAEPALRHAFEDLPVAVQLPTAEALARAREVVALGEERAGRWEYTLARVGVLPLWEEFKDRPEDAVAIHAVRIGQCAIITNPAELYCQFGIDLRRRSPAAVTMVAQLADGSVGYCPTIPALLGGGYSGAAIRWRRLEPQAGYKLVEASARLVHQLWRD